MTNDQITELRISAFYAMEMAKSYNYNDCFYICFGILMSNVDDFDIDGKMVGDLAHEWASIHSPLFV